MQVNGNGLLDLEEVGELAALMQGGKPLSKTQLQVAMRDMDKDNSGEVDFDEFYVWWKVHSTASPGLFKRIFGR